MESALEPTARPDRKAIGLIFFTIFLDILGSTILLPVQAFIMREYDTSALAVGLLSVIYSAAQFLAAPVLGRLSDRYGRRPVLLICLAGSAVGYFMFGIGGALWVLFLSRLIDGISGGNISTAQAYIADVTPPHERAKNFALVGVAFGLGFILGPVIAGLLVPFGLAAPALAAGIFSLAAAVFGYFFLPESLPKEHREEKPISLADLNPFGTAAQMLKLPGLGGLLSAVFLFNFAFSGMINNSSVYLIERHAIQPSEIAILLTLLGVVNVVAQGFIVRKFAPRWGERRLALSGLSLLALAYMTFTLAPTLWAVLPPVLLMGIGNAFSVPAFGALAANKVSEREQGKIAGVSASVTTLASAFGPLWAGLAYDALAADMPYWSGAAVLIIAFTLILRLK
jgi:MFS transporter, DHA1 family, tetracycline resistance protein